MSGSNPTTQESPWARRALIGVGFLFLALFLFLPLVMVFAGGLAKGWQVFVDALVDPDALAAIRLTLLVAAIAFVVAIGVRPVYAPVHGSAPHLRPPLRGPPTLLSTV